jgi:hypothetical protein
VFLSPHMEVVKFVKTKPPEVILLVLLLLRVVCGRCRRKALLPAECFGGNLFPNFKSRCRLLRKLEWCPRLTVRCVFVTFLSA